MDKPWRSDKWFTSPWDYTEEVRAQCNFADKIQIHDVSLRDGEQQSGFVFSIDQKIAIAEALADIGIHRIEAGMPAVSADDQYVVSQIAKKNLGMEVLAFTRCMKKDIDLALDCGCTGVITEIGFSKHMIEQSYGWEVERALNQACEVTHYAHEKGLKTVFFPIDSTRADIDWFLTNLAYVAKNGYMDALTLPDSLGVINTHAVPFFIKAVKKVVDVPVEVHFHDDFGIGAANTVAALAAGANCAHTTISGIGERAGNVPYEDVVLTLKLLYGKDIGIDLSKMYSLHQLIKEVSGGQFRRNRPIVGDAIFELESGIPCSFYEKIGKEHPEVVFPFTADLVGQKGYSIVVGKLSGAPSIRLALEAVGMEKSEEEVRELLAIVKQCSINKNRSLTQEEFLECVEQLDKA
ncbi:MAG: pyruvate carboxyltransferase [Clostridia bacterium]|nr:pyruvate carboxyltransferase [Clostridia bacterium]